MIDLRWLAARRAELGPQRFAELLTQAAGSGDAKVITSLIDQLEAADTGNDGPPGTDE